jgi:hypothetical protein
MPSPSILQSIGYINWTVLFALSLGSFTTVVAVRLLAEATRGYLVFTAFTAAVLGLLALATDLGLPDPAALAIHSAPTLDAARRVALAVFVVLAAGYGVVLLRRGSSAALGLAAIVAGVAAAGIAAFGWAGGPLPGIPLLIQYLALSGALGGALAALILGHWYLVTPRLSEQPLVLVASGLYWVVIIQLLLFGVWVTIGTGTDSAPFRPLVGGSALLVWLRLLVGLVFPAVLCWMAVKTARTRSMESATGLLYIGVAAIAAGTIVAGALYYGSGLIV